MVLADLGLRFSGHDRPSRRRGRKTGPGRAGLLGLERLEDRLVLATSTWSGAASALWSNAGNWDVPPVAGSNLVFPSGAAHLTNTNDLTAGTAFGSLTVGASGYAISGNAVALAGPLDGTLASGTSTIALPVNLAANLVLAVDHAGASLVLSGVIGGAAGLNKQGPGNAVLSAANNFTGTTAVLGGGLVIDGAHPGSPVTVASGTTLAGFGTVGTISSAGGTVSPGDPAPGLLTDSGNLTLDSASKFLAVADQTTPASGYSQLAVAGTVNLGGATLQLTVSYAPATGDQLTLINDTGSSPVTGTFAGLPEGSVVSAGGHSFKISYAGGTGNDVVLTALAPSTTTVVAAPTSSTFGQSVTLTATVGNSGGVGTPTGSVEFFSGTTSLGTATLSGGTAALPVTTLPAGTDTVTAQYKGDSTFSVSTSAGVTVTVAKSTTTTTLAAAPNPSAAGASVTLTATVAPVSPGAGVPTGTVTFVNGTTTLGTGTLTNGVATLTTGALPVGTDSLSASYTGDASFVASAGTATTTVSQGSTTTALTTSNANPASGQPVTFTATVATPNSGLGSPTGTVTFLNGTTSIGTATLANGVATLTTSSLPVGTASITASYPGDANFGSSKSTAVTETVGQSATTTTLTASKSNPVDFEAVTLTAKVAPVAPGTGTPSGTVEFFSNGTSLGTGTLSGGTATLVTTAMKPGVDTITAVYQGATNFAGSTSAAITETVGTSIEQLINQVYLDVIGTGADEAGLNDWRTRVVTGTPLKVVIREIINSRASLEHSVQTTYQTFLGRAATPAEVGSAVSPPNSSYATVYASVLGSREYYEASGGTVNGFLTDLYQDVVGVAIPEATLTALTNDLNGGDSRYQVALKVVTSDAGRSALVKGLFSSLLGRSATILPGNIYVEQLERGVGIRGLTIELLTSNEFLSKYPNAS